MTEASWLGSLVAAARPPHWVKNLLVFLPVVTGHAVIDASAMAMASLAFIIFCLAASGGYLVNDLHDLAFDRSHPEKRLRPLAAGSVPAPAAAVTAGLMLAASGVAALLWMPIAFVGTLALYVVTAQAYSFLLKRVLFLDVIVLTALYLFRIIAGGIATGLYVSPWLLALSLFFFLSLALLKRYAELRHWPETAETSGGRGRAYLAVDADILRSVGPASGLLSVFLLALYINSGQARDLYRTPDLLWLLGPALIYWIVRMWLLAHRGLMRDDPVLFAARDPTTYAVAALVGLLLLAATIGIGPA